MAGTAGLQKDNSGLHKEQQHSSIGGDVELGAVRARFSLAELSGQERARSTGGGLL